MIIKSLRLKDFRGYPSAQLSFENFTCLVGPNGIGKTSVLEAISLLCSSLDFGTDPEPEETTETTWVPTVSARQRLAEYLRKNIRSYGLPDDPKGFEISGVFEHGGQELTVVLNEKGFVRNDIVDQPWWWQRIAYFARFDMDMTRFQLKKSLWDKFASHFEGITGFQVEPEVMLESDLVEHGLDGEMVVGFWMNKGSRGKIHSRRASAGERKIAKAIAEIISLGKTPHIALVDNLEMHVHYKRHAQMFDELMRLFSGIQIIATTHSTVLMQKYEASSQLIDIEKALEEDHGRVSEG